MVAEGILVRPSRVHHIKRLPLFIMFHDTIRRASRGSSATAEPLSSIDYSFIETLCRPLWYNTVLNAMCLLAYIHHNNI